MAGMVRVNARVSSDVNKWLDDYSKKTGVPKSTIVYMALEQFKLTKEGTEAFSNMSVVFEQIDKAMQSYQKELNELKKELNDLKKS